MRTSAFTQSECTTATLFEPEWIYQQRLSLSNIVHIQDRAYSCLPDSVEDIWTDGSCRDPALPVISRAGLAIVWGHDSNQYISEPLPGLIKTSARAEVAACLLALHTAQRRIRIHSDCAYVINTALKIGHVERFCYTGAHRDLWQAIHRLLQSTCRGTIFLKVKAHVRITIQHTEEEIHSFTMNELADQAAKNAVYKHTLPSVYIDTYK